MAMSLVIWSPAMGITAVWRIAPSVNTAMSVVPPPMSTRHTPRSFSSSVSTAMLEASGCRIRSRTSRPQRLMHLMMFCAADTAPVTMCTFTSRRMPLMPSGSRTSSWPSMMNSWVRMWRICWSVGMLTALAVSITRSTSIWRHFLVLDRHHAVRVEALDVAAGDAGIDLADLAVGHQFGFFQRALDGVDGGLDVHHHAFLQAARRVLADADDLQPAVGQDFRHHGDDFRGADIQPDDQCFLFLGPAHFTPLTHLQVLLPQRRRGAPRNRWDSADPHN